MVRIIWTEEATGNLTAIVDYLHEHDPAAAERIAERLIAAGESLRHFPNRGRVAPRGRRELSIVWPYIMRYRLVRETVYIERVRHGAQLPDQ